MTNRIEYLKKYHKQPKWKKYNREWMKTWRKNHPEKQLLLSRKYTANRKNKLGNNFYKIQALSISKWRELNPQKVKAHRKVFCALRNKSLTKSPCFCGNIKSEAHHEDYSKPLEIIWLCKRHHTEADKKLRERLIPNLSTY